MNETWSITYQIKSTEADAGHGTRIKYMLIFNNSMIISTLETEKIDTKKK